MDQAAERYDMRLLNTDINRLASAFRRIREACANRVAFEAHLVGNAELFLRHNLADDRLADPAFRRLVATQLVRVILGSA